jgi:hypothetical protein
MIRISILLTLALAACDAAPRVAVGVPSHDVDGDAWSAPSQADALSAALGVAARHEIAAAAVDAGGVLHAVFAVDADGDGRADALEYAQMKDGAWSAPEPVVSTMSLADAAQLAVDGDGAVHVLWCGHTGSQAARDVPTELVQRVRIDGRWTAPRVLYREPSRWGMGARWLAAATDSAGDVQVLYAPQGRGFGHLSLRGEHVGPADYLDHDGNMMTFSTSAAGAPLVVAYIGEMVSRERPRAVNDVFVRSLRGGRWSAKTEAYYGPGRWSHYPQLVIDGRGVQHLFWLEDTNGTVPPEALFHATSPDGVRWSPPRDLTPQALRGGVLFRVAAVPGEGGRIHLLLRHARADGTNAGLYAIDLRGGEPGPARTLAGPGALGPGEAQLVRDPSRHRVIAVWRGHDGIYRSSSQPE